MRNILILGCLIILMTSLGVCDDAKFKHPPAQSDLTPRTKYVDMQVGSALPTPTMSNKNAELIVVLQGMNEKLDDIIRFLRISNGPR
jgi:hypothetical protein